MGWQPRKSALPVPEQPEQFPLLALGTHLPLEHSLSTVQ